MRLSRVFVSICIVILLAFTLMLSAQVTQAGSQGMNATIAVTGAVPVTYSGPWPTYAPTAVLYWDRYWNRVYLPLVRR